MKKSVWVILIAILIVIVGCSKSNDSTNTTPGNNTTPSQSPSNTQNEGQISTDPDAKYDPPIEITTVRSVAASVSFDEGENYDSNGVYDAYERDFGIKVTNLWSVDASQYNQRVTLAIASNDIPDLMRVNALQFQQLLDADMIMDITEIYDQYATDFTKQFMTRDGGGQMESANYQGKLMAIPYTDGPFNQSQFLWVRKDWLEKLNLPEPKTMQDVIEISKAFTERDPNETGSRDTYGLGLHMALYGGSVGLQGFFNGFHAYPDIWIERNGELVYGSIQPETKTALLQLQEMFKDGQIDGEFGVKDSNKAAEFMAADRIGMQYGSWWNGNSPIGIGAVRDGELVQDWEVYPLVSIDDQPALTQIFKATGEYYVISKDAKHPEAIIKMLNQVIYAVESAIDEETTYYLEGKEDRSTGTAGQTYYALNPTFVGSQDRFPNVGKLITSAVNAQDKTILPPGDYALYDFLMSYNEGNIDNWGFHMQLKENGSLEHMYKYFSEGLYQYNEFYGGMTPSMTEKNSTLKAKEIEIFTKIIMNDAPIDEFDNFVEQWKVLGGEEITQEINEWYVNKQ